MPGSEPDDTVGRAAEIYAEAFADCVGRPNFNDNLKYDFDQMQP